MQDVIPANHLLAMLEHNFRESAVEVSLQVVIALQLVFTHEDLDPRISVPLPSRYLVATDVQIFVREQLDHLTQKRIDALINLLSRGIKAWDL
jgi:hypothetical protein